jgi:hypothetical protein
MPRDLESGQGAGQHMFEEESAQQKPQKQNGLGKALQRMPVRKKSETAADSPATTGTDTRWVCEPPVGIVGRFLSDMD